MPSPHLNALNELVTNARSTFTDMEASIEAERQVRAVAYAPLKEAEHESDANMNFILKVGELLPVSVDYINGLYCESSVQKPVFGLKTTQFQPKTEYEAAVLHSLSVWGVHSYDTNFGYVPGRYHPYQPLFSPTFLAGVRHRTKKETDLLLLTPSHKVDFDQMEWCGKHRPPGDGYPNGQQRTLDPTLRVRTLKPKEFQRLEKLMEQRLENASLLPNLDLASRIGRYPVAKLVPIHLKGTEKPIYPFEETGNYYAREGRIKTHRHHEESPTIRDLHLDDDSYDMFGIDKHLANLAAAFKFESKLTDLVQSKTA